MNSPDSRYPLISSLTCPHDVRKLDQAGVAALAAEMRRAIIGSVSRNGGHLGSSLGTVELTIALHAELDSPRDRLLWDVGHQAYGHKLLSGRLDRFDTLRQHGGMSGFLSRAESEHDVMGAGHASTSISYAVGLGEAARRDDTPPGRAVAIIGDGALTGGMAYEGLNQAGSLRTPLVVVLNDNGMSIAPNVGALSLLFQKARLDPTLKRMWNVLERGVSAIPGAEGPGGALKDATKAFFSQGALFEALGFQYVGPLDGHNVGEMRSALRRALESNRPTLVHVHTIKGKGYAPAENHGEGMHGATPFVIESGEAARPSAAAPTFTDVFGKALVAEAESDPRVVGITAAMPNGTGLHHMARRFPERTYDVGIAEQHATVFACGLAIAGLRPVCAIYSTFLQRAFDPIVHDVALQNLPVVFAIDRGGLVGDDGATHHGVFDIAYLRTVPNLTLMAPMDEQELVDMLHTALQLNGPVAFRYPRGSGSGVTPHRTPEALEIGVAQVLEKGERVALVGYGYGALLAREAANLVADVIGCRPTVVNARFVKPLDGALMRSLAASHDLVVTIEDHAVQGGFGSAVMEAIAPAPARVLALGVPDRFVEHGKREILLEEVGLCATGIAARTLRALAAAVSEPLSTT
jgi:1-deoxy-D-xylulose-5-phosphate synthase